MAGKTRKKRASAQEEFTMRVKRMKEAGHTIAVATFNDPTVKGAVSFLQVGKSIQVEAICWEMPAGRHGFHIHEFGNLLEGCASLGAHWNPTGEEHGGPHSKGRHMGDFGNIKRGILMRYKITPAKIYGNSKYSLLGRSVVIHEGEDDLGQGDKPDSKTTGGSGARIGCAIIGMA